MFADVSTAIATLAFTGTGVAHCADAGTAPSKAPTKTPQHARATQATYQNPIVAGRGLSIQSDSAVERRRSRVDATRV